jgi:hypothetical protein
LPIPVPNSIKRLVPKEDRNLFKKVHFGEKNPYTNEEDHTLWLAKTLPGGILWLRSRDDMKTDSGKFTILHEYGHMVWFFKLTDDARHMFKRVHSKIVESIKQKESEILSKSRTPSIDRIFLYQEAIHKDPEEAFAELYAAYHMNRLGISDYWVNYRRKSPVLCETFIKVKDMRK